MYKRKIIISQNRGLFCLLAGWAKRNGPRAGAKGQEQGGGQAGFRSRMRLSGSASGHRTHGEFRACASVFGFVFFAEEGRY